MPGRLENLRIVDQPLTTVARGFSNDIYVGEKLFPVVKVDSEGGKIPRWGKEQFRIYQTNRAIRANSNEMEGSWLDTVSYALTEHDILQRLDYREVQNAKVPLEVKATQNVMDQILLTYEKKQADLAQDLTTYPETNKVTLTDDYFNESAIDWIEYLHSKKAVLSKQIAKDANTMILPKHVWDILKFHPKLKAYITVNQELFAAIASLQKLQEILEIPNIHVAPARYSPDGSTFDYVWGNNIILAYVVPPSGVDRTPYEPCFGYTLRMNGYPYADKWDDENGKIRKVRATDLYDIKVVGSDSAYIIHNPIDPAVYAV